MNFTFAVFIRFLYAHKQMTARRNISPIFIKNIIYAENGRILLNTTNKFFLGIQKGPCPHKDNMRARPKAPYRYRTRGEQDADIAAIVNYLKHPLQIINH